VPSIESVEQISIDDISDSLLFECVEIVRSIYTSLTKDGETPKGPDVLKTIKRIINEPISAMNAINKETTI
jgi:hypothetical protein